MREVSIKNVKGKETCLFEENKFLYIKSKIGQWSSKYGCSIYTIFNNFIILVNNWLINLVDLGI